MARLAAYLSSFLVSLFGYFGQWLGSKAALAVTLVTASMALTVALFAAAKVLVSAIVIAVPYEPFVMAFYACWPSNAETCIAACFGVDVLVFGYRYKDRLIGALAR